MVFSLSLICSFCSLPLSLLYIAPLFWFCCYIPFSQCLSQSLTLSHSQCFSFLIIWIFGEFGASSSRKLRWILAKNKVSCFYFCEYKAINTELKKKRNKTQMSENEKKNDIKESLSIEFVFVAWEWRERERN